MRAITTMKICQIDLSPTMLAVVVSLLNSDFIPDSNYWYLPKGLVYRQNQFWLTSWILLPNILVRESFSGEVVWWPSEASGREALTTSIYIAGGLWHSSLMGTRGSYGHHLYWQRPLVNRKPGFQLPEASGNINAGHKSLSCPKNTTPWAFGKINAMSVKL